MSDKYKIDDIRKKLSSALKGKSMDPDEFRAKKVENNNEVIKYRFFVLPPFKAGDKLKGGPASQNMEQFFIHHGVHWIQNRPHPCPRLHHGEECPICSFGFELLKETKDEDRRKAIMSDWMPSSSYLVNIHFPAWVKSNPEELRGRTMFYNAPKTCFDLWTACIMRDSSSEEDPEAFGVFFDETAGFLFELNVARKGKNNSYAASKFIANNGVAQPMVRDDNFKALLESRHNLFDKFQKPDMLAIKRLADSLINGDSASVEESAGFDVDETEEPKQKSKSFSNEAPVREDTKAKSNKLAFDADEEEPAPKPKSRPKPSAKFEEEDDEEDKVEKLLNSLNSDDDE